MAGTVVVLMTLSFVTGFLASGFLGTALPGARRDSPTSRLAPISAPTVDPAGQGLTGSQVPDARPPADLGRQFDPFWEAWNFAEREHYRQPVDRTSLIRGAIKGLLGSLNDQQAAYLDPVANRIEKANLDGVQEGIGASVELKERRHTIVAPVEDGPAARSGLRTGDVILRIDGKEIGALSLAEAVSLMRGPAGTKVRLTVQRTDEPESPPLEVEITRARIELEVVSSRLVADGIGYVRIRVFGSQTVPQVARALREMRARRVRGLILDLRDNPGGYFSSATEVASHFVKDGKVIVLEERDGNRRPTLARTGGLATDLTLAVLVNRGTASASEIVAGAVRDHDRGVLIGEPTFGKGTVQLQRDLSDGSSVKVTTGTWLTPNGRTIEGQGLTPNLLVKPTAEDERAKRDVALERALELFKGPPPAPAGAPASVPDAPVPAPEAPLSVPETPVPTVAAPAPAAT
ncbi:MAG: S41 family peptidase [Chloroflexota bacterium]|nr:S41 family peptidase [Chloroflexota bacterium]